VHCSVQTPPSHKQKTQKGRRDADLQTVAEGATLTSALRRAWEPNMIDPTHLPSSASQRFEDSFRREGTEGLAHEL
jgi:hypothetical protein